MLIQQKINWLNYSITNYRYDLINIDRAINSCYQCFVSAGVNVRLVFIKLNLVQF